MLRGGAGPALPGGEARPIAERCCVRVLPARLEASPPASHFRGVADLEEQGNRMSSPVDPKIKQALRKKPAERTPEVRGLRLLPRCGF